jgi:UDP-2,3-diacylglucosamine hydrolase
VNNSYFFISDIHLGLQSREKEEKKERHLVRLLNYIGGADGAELFIVGDLFDYWFEYRKVYQKGFFRTLTALQDLTEKGINISYIIGNHDFMHRDFFAAEIGCKMYEDGVERVIEGKKFFIAHGDGLIKNDYGYNILKKILRNKTLQEVYSWVHPDIGVSLASKSSKTSRDYTTKKDYGEADGLMDAARLKIDEGFDYVLFGHLHQKRFELYHNGCYINLGSWLDQPCYGLYKDKKFEIVDFPMSEESVLEK